MEIINKLDAGGRGRGEGVIFLVLFQYDTYDKIVLHGASLVYLAILKGDRLKFRRSENIYLYIYLYIYLFDQLYIYVIYNYIYLLDQVLNFERFKRYDKIVKNKD